MMTETYSIGQVAQITKLSIDTLRYYEREGLIPPVPRADNGHRQYSQLDIGWIEFAKCLRAAGLPISLIKDYLTLGDMGTSTRPERLSLLNTHRDSIQQKIEELSKYLTMLDEKIELYHHHMSLENELVE